MFRPSILDIPAIYNKSNCRYIVRSTYWFIIIIYYYLSIIIFYIFLLIILLFISSYLF